MKSEKQTQNKPNSNPIKPCPELAEALNSAKGVAEWVEGNGPISSAVGGFKPDDAFSAYYTRDCHMRVLKY